MVLLDKKEIEVIENIVKNKGIAEVKTERGKVVIVQIARQVKYPEKK